MEKAILCAALIVVFFIVMVCVGFYSRKHATDVNGFVLGGRSVGPWLTAFAFGTSYFSAVIFVGYAGQFGWNFGLASTWIGLGNAFIGSLLAWNILGRRTRVMTQHLDAKTMPDFFAKRFASKKLKLAASIIIFVFLIPYTASLYNGLSSLFNMVFDIPYWVIILVMAVLTGLYVIFGGYMATAINDFIQGIIMLFGIVAVVAAVIVNQGGFHAAMTKLSEVPAPGWVHGAFTSFLGPDPLALLFVVILTSLGTWGLPQMIGKFYSIKSENDIQKGTIISTFFAIVVAGGCYFLGGFGRLLPDDVVAQLSIPGPEKKIMFDGIVPKLIEPLPSVIIAVVIVLVLSASMSTLSSLVLTSSSTLSLDIIRPALQKYVLNKKLSEKKLIAIMRIFIVFFIAVSAVIAVLKDANPGFTFIAQMMGISWGALAGAFLAPFLYGLYWKRTTKAGCIACNIWGCGLMIVQLIITLGGIDVTGWGPVLGFIFKSSINSGVIAMLGGLIIVPLVSAFTKHYNKTEVDEMFAGYEERVEVTAKSRIQD